MSTHGKLRSLVAYVRILLLGMFLAGGALLGMPLRPQEIEAHMQSMANAEMVQILEEENQASGDPPPM
ncbi:MAG TPA: hypothetical protein VGK64_19715 [Bryobacteraceae bacterium]